MKTFTKNQKVRIIFTENNTAIFATAKYLGSQQANANGAKLHEVELCEDLKEVDYETGNILYMNDEEVYAMEEK